MLTLLAIALGVAATVASMVVSDSVAATLSERPTRSDVGVVVANGDAPIYEQARAGLGALPGVTAATGVRAGRAGLIGADGKLVTAPDKAGTGFDGTGRFSLVSGKAPAHNGEIALETKAAKKAGLSAGGTARVVLNGEQVTLAVVGVYDYRPVGPASGTITDPVPAVAFDGATAAGLFPGYERVELTTNADPAAIVAAARGAMPRAAVAPGTELSSAAKDEVEGNASDLREMLLPFAAIALLVGMFVISNTFTVLGAQRLRQFALLRAVGARRGQLRRSVLTEAAVLGLAGGTLGVALGIGLGPLVLSAMRPDEDTAYTVTPLAILIGYAAAIVVTVLAAGGAARRAAAVPPVAALRTDPVVPGRVLRDRTLTGAGLIVASVGTVVLTGDPGADNTTRIIGLCGAVVGVIGVVLVAPALVVPVLAPVRAVVGRFGGPSARIGVRGAGRDPRRTASTATAITVGLALIGAFGTISASLAGLIGSTTKANVPVSTTVLQPAAGGDSALVPSDLDSVKRLPGVDFAAGSRDSLAVVRYPGGETRRKSAAIEPEALGTVLTPKITAGSADVRRGVVISQNEADMLGVKLGDPLTLTIEPAPPISTVVTGVYAATEFSASLYYDVSLAPPAVRDHLTTIYATGHDPAAAKRAIESAFGHRPDVGVTDRDGVVAQNVETQAIGFSMLYAMVAVAIVIAVLGVTTTLALSVMERTREIGVLRAIGARRRLVRATILAESAVISVFGALLGVLSGAAVGTVLQRAMFGQPLGAAVIPFDVIGIALLGVVVAALIAALWPAQRAASADPLAAVNAA
ncbi:ABC transporter permease [Amycolatopsis sp. CA-230715]|uniref:ABC transporter permease n=1 Tax=Amycolatopsis sp. CA-230715 TaxID=2745196 RepID=UPI001C010BA4|nr:FtsX-like permease family protein [Amycolatopsis sp. CA-230715]